MSMNINTLKIKNFLSVGNTEQEINMNNNLMNLLVGINKDKDSEGCSNGSGKAQPLDAKIKISGGWTTMGNLKVGDKIIGKDLTPITVDGIFPQGKQSVYKIEFVDGRSTEATKDHLWEIARRNDVKSDERDIVTTSDIISLLKKNIKVEIECGAEEIDYNKPDPTLPYDIKKLGKLVAKGIVTEIPDDFMIMNHSQFVDFYLALANENGVGRDEDKISSSIPKNAWEKFVELGKRFGNYIEPMVEYQNLIIFILHLDNIIPIKSISYVGVKECQCIHVDSEDHLYITDDYILTHNTTCINALSYAIYGESLSEIKKDNLVNKTNTKNMEVILEFVKDSVKFVIHRGRKPNILKFYINDEEYDEARASVRDTQSEIEHVFGMSYNMFKTIVVLDSTSVPFLSLKDKDRKPIIEELLGITILSKKAELLKQKIKDIKQSIKEEELKINLKETNNDRINENIKNLHIRKDLWEKNHQNKLTELTSIFNSYSTDVDMDKEIENHKLKDEYDKLVKSIGDFQSTTATLTTTIEKKKNELENTNKLLDEAKNHKCPECKQEIHSETFMTIVKNLTNKKEQIINEINELESDLLLVEDEFLKVVDIFEKTDEPKCMFDNVHEAYSYSSKIRESEKDLLHEYEKENPFIEQIKNLEESSLENISYDVINSLSKNEEHMNFLYKLLTNSDSFIRKNIIDQNLSFLNKRLSFYSDQLVLLQDIKFNSDLSITISKKGDEFDFSQLSTGEKTRVTLSLSLAFRDVWERLNTSINIWFFDEIIDSGMDQQGIQDAIKLLEQFVNERNKDVFLISHKLDLAANIENVLYAVMENGFTEYQK